MRCTVAVLTPSVVPPRTITWVVSVPRPAGEYQGRPPSFLPHPAPARHPTAITTKPSLRTAIRSNLDQQQRIPVAQLSPSPDCATCVMPLNVLENCIACNLAEHATVRISSTDPHQISGRLHRFRRVSMGCSAGDAGAPLNPFRI